MNLRKDHYHTKIQDLSFYCECVSPSDMRQSSSIVLSWTEQPCLLGRIPIVCALSGVPGFLLGLLLVVFVNQGMSVMIGSISIITSISIIDGIADARGDGTCVDALCIIYKFHLSYCERERTGMTLKQRTVRG